MDSTRNKTWAQLELDFLAPQREKKTTSKIRQAAPPPTVEPEERGASFSQKYNSLTSLSRETEGDLIREVQTGGPNAKKALETLMMHNLRAVATMARRYTRFGCPLEDLVSEGTIGLQEAIKKFDASKGNRLGTYAVWWIKQYLRKALTENCRTIRIPICQQNTVKMIHETAARLTEITGSYPSDEEIAEEAGLEPWKVQNLRSLTVPMVSLQNPVGESGRDARTYEDILSDQTGSGESPLETLTKKNGGLTLKAIIGKRLNTKEQQVISLRFGLDSEEPGKTLEEVGGLLGLTRERIRQIQDMALKKLRRTLEAERELRPTLLSLFPQMA